MSSAKTNDAERNPVDALAEQFVEQLRRGERPSVSEYVARRPELEREIRDLFPTLAMLEQCGPVPSHPAPPRATGPAAGLPGRLGAYRILREVGRGGMGIVYEAELQVWDLRALREKLAELDLDWEGPSPPPDPSRPWSLEVVDEGG